MAGSFYGSRKLTLVLSAQVSFSPGSDFSQARNKVLQNSSIFKIYFFYISLAKIAVHN